MIKPLLQFIACFLTLCSVASNTFAQQTEAQRIDKYIEEKMANSKLPGLAVAVVHYDSVILAKGYGATPDGASINSHTPFALASLSKAFTATAVMQLVEADKVGLDVPVIRYLPNWMPSEPKRNLVTVRHLLQQISGLGDKGYAEFKLDKQPDNLDGVIKAMNKAHLISEPGKQFHYTNPNYQVLAKIVEITSGEHFSDYLRNHIFRSLGMNETYDVGNVNDFFGPTHYLPKGNIFVLGQPVAYTEPEWFIDGDAGIASTANDMAKWMSFQLKANTTDSGMVLKPASLKMMQTAPTGINSTYGMGWHINKDAHLLYHSGIMWTYSTQEMLLTDKGYGIVLLFNGGTDNLTDYYSFLQGIQDVINGDKPDTGAFPRWLYTLLASLALAATLFLGIRRLRRTGKWYESGEKRPAWNTWLYMLLRLMPLVLLLLIPTLITVASGRVLNWPRIALMFPDLVMFLGLLALLNLLIVLSRLQYVHRKRRLTQ